MDVQETNVTVNEEALKQFTAELLKAMEEKMADYGISKIETTSATKNNVGQIEGLTARFSDGSNMSPNIYPSMMIKAYEDGKSIDELAEEGLKIFDTAHKNNPDFNVSSICAENAKDHLTMVLVNKEMNKELAEKCPHLEVNDLIAIPKWRVDLGNGEHGTITVTHDIQSKLLQMTDEEICSIARGNTISDNYTIKGMNEVMAEIMGADLPPEFIAEMMPQEEMMYVVSNEEKLNGATALMDKATLEKVKEVIGEDNYFVIPSSVHEVLVVPESKVTDPADLKEMCESVNATEVSAQDRLGSNIYRYDGEKHKLSICNKVEQLKEQTMPIDLSKVETQHFSVKRGM